MNRSAIAMAVLLLGVAYACSSSPSTPSTSTPTVPTVGGTMFAANENPPVTNVDALGTGTVTTKLNVTKDASGTVTAATADFTVTLSGFPAGTTLTGAHIHPGVAGLNGPIVVNTGITSGEIVLANGSGSFTRTGATVQPTDAQVLLTNPAAYYFNVHTQANPGGAIRAQLVAQ